MREERVNSRLDIRGSGVKLPPREMGGFSSRAAPHASTTPGPLRTWLGTEAFVLR